MLHTRPILFVLALALCLMRPAPAAADAITFDDLAAPSAGWGDVPTDYAGMQWHGFETVTNDYFRDSYRNTYDFPSNEMAAYNGDGALEVSFSRAEAFDLTGAAFGGWTAYDSKPWYSAKTLTLRGFLSGEQVAETSIALSFGAFEEFALNCEGVDEVRFTSDGEEHYWLMDDVHIEEASGGGAVAPTPIPATIWLMGAG
ncbi:MAG: hypothetical protein ACOCVM_08625, partial [Desulfovibrionaceae bacterium]